MRLPRFIKLSGVMFVFALLALLVGVQQSTMAGPLPQATASLAATSGAAGGAAGVTLAATLAGTMTFPPCPPATMAATSGAAGGAAGATAVASMAATSAAAGGATVAASPAATTVVTNPGYLGVRVEAVDACGVRVLEVLPNSPASTAGIQTQDVIVGIDGVAVTGINQARQAIEGKEAGTSVQLTIQRGSSQMTISVTLAAQPAGGAAGATMAPTSGAAGSTTGGASATTPATP